MDFCVNVRFKRVGSVAWSKTYSYKSKLEFREGELVVVPAGDFFTVGEVVSCSTKFEFKPGVNYKRVHSLVPKCSDN